MKALFQAEVGEKCKKHPVDPKDWPLQQKQVHQPIHLPVGGKNRNATPGNSSYRGLSRSKSKSDGRN
jgi:hypothetical protein